MAIIVIRIIFITVILLTGCGKKGDLQTYDNETREKKPAKIEEDRIYKF
tara:strand:+ start:1554 stop:1700 length:147 start_codon:yes stop_codon:yes gene_type:complete